MKQTPVAHLDLGHVVAIHKVELQVVRVLAVQGCAVVLQITHTCRAKQTNNKADIGDRGR